MTQQVSVQSGTQVGVAQGKQKYEPLPDGTYRLRMKNFKLGTSKAGHTKLTAAFEVMTGDYKKRLIFMDYLLTHSNPEAIVVSADKLTKYLKSVGCKETFNGDPAILEQYIESPFQGEIKTEDDGKGPKRMKIVKYFAQ